MIERWLDLIAFFISSKKLFYLKHSIYLLQIFIVRFNLPTNEFSADGVVESFRRWIDCKSKTFCVREFESQLCRLVFKNTWTEFGEHNNLCLPQLIITHRDSCQITKTKRTNRLAKIRRLGKKPTFQSFRILLEAMQCGWLDIYAFLWKPLKQKYFEKLQVSFVAQVFSKKIIFFSVGEFRKDVFPKFLFRFVSLFESSNRLLRKTWIFSEMNWSIKSFDLVLFWN